jgi:hypothetical protein
MRSSTTASRRSAGKSSSPSNSRARSRAMQASTAPASDTSAQLGQRACWLRLTSLAAERKSPGGGPRLVRCNPLSRRRREVPHRMIAPLGDGSPRIYSRRPSPDDRAGKPGIALVKSGARVATRDAVACRYRRRFALAVRVGVRLRRPAFRGHRDNAAWRSPPARRPLAGRHTPESADEEVQRATWTAKPVCRSGACSFAARSTGSPKPLRFLFDSAIGDYTQTATHFLPCGSRATGET